jgi:hypothetical protein
MKNKIAQALTARYPHLKDYQITKCVDKYVVTMIDAIAVSIVTFGVNQEQLSLPMTELRLEAGRVAIGGKKEWITDVMHQDPKTSLVTIDFKGNVGKNSRVSLNTLYEQQIMDELINLNYELNGKRLKELQAQANLNFEIDMNSLDDYLIKTGETYTASSNDPSKKAYADALARNYLVANQIKQQATFQNGKYSVDEYWTTLDSGRIYGHGMSLQRVSKCLVPPDHKHV